MSPRTPVNEFAKTNFAAWNDSLLSQDPEKVVSLYHPRASIIPAMRSRILTGTHEMNGFFSNFLKLGPSAELINGSASPLSEHEGVPDMYLHTSVCVICFSDHGHHPMTLFSSFLWICDHSGDWKIRHQHDSLLTP